MMTHLFRRIVAIAAAAAVLVGLSACSGANDATGSATGSKDIQIWYRPGSLPTAALNGVQAAFPSVHIKLVKSPDADAKLASALRANQNIPDIAVANIFVLAPAASKFANVDDYGFKNAAANYLSWKVQAAQDANGRQIGIPIDIGPDGFFYRADVFKSVGLPTDPAAVGKLVSTWGGYESVAKTVTGAGKGFVCDSAGSSILTTEMVGAGKYFYSNGKPLIDSPLTKSSFMTALSFGQHGLCLNADPYTTDWSAGIAQNKLVGWVGPAYQIGPMEQAGGSGDGQWRVTTPPGGSSSRIGSNLAVFKASANPALATEIAIWLTNPTNQAKGYAQDSLFPSTPASYSLPALNQKDPYFGGQVTASVLADVAKSAPMVDAGQYSTVIETAFYTALSNAIHNKQAPDAAFAAGVRAANG